MTKLSHFTASRFTRERERERITLHSTKMTSETCNIIKQQAPSHCNNNQASTKQQLTASMKMETETNKNIRENENNKINIFVWFFLPRVCLTLGVRIHLNWYYYIQTFSASVCSYRFVVESTRIEKTEHARNVMFDVIAEQNVSQCR